MGYSVGMLWIGVVMIVIAACYNIYKMQTAYIADVSDYYSVEEGIAESLGQTLTSLGPTIRLACWR